MAMEKANNMHKKHPVLGFFIVLFAVLGICVCIVPYLPLKEGWLITAVLKGLYNIAVDYIGFFNAENLQQFTLLPFALYCVLIAIEVILSMSLAYLFFETLALIGFYIISAYIHGGTAYFKTIRIFPFNNWHFVGFALVFIAIPAIVFLVLKETEFSRNENQPKAEKKKSPKNVSSKSDLTDNLDLQGDIDLSEIAPIQRPDCDPSTLSEESAIALLESVVVPEFKIFPNYSKESVSAYVKTNSTEADSSIYPGIFAIASLDGDLHRNAMTQNGKEQIEKFEKNRMLSDSFKPRNIKRKLEEDEKRGQLFPKVDGEVEFDLSSLMVHSSDISHVNKFAEPEKQPEKQVERTADVPQSVVEPSASESEFEESKIEEPKLDYPETDYATTEDIKLDQTEDVGFDFVSGVGGLRSARDGKYVYDTSKFIYQFPSESLLVHYEQGAKKSVDLANDVDGHTIVDTLSQFRIETQLVGVQYGPTFTLYELALAKGIRVNSVLNLADNIAMDLAVPSVRILAPIPGRSAIGIEVPNKKRDTIGFDMMMNTLKSKSFKIPMVLGKTITGESIVIDLTGTPHLLIAGTTGSGKSVCVNSLICSVLFTKTPQQVRMILVDPKMVELTIYNDIPHLLTPVITDAKRAIKVMAYVVEEMERRMSMFSMLNARKIEDYNAKIKEKSLLRAQLPYIMVIIDEFADLMMIVGKELESYIKRITAMARFTGIHLVLATQRPSSDVITGIIKSNIPTQIAFAVSNQLNSRIILDNVGAEKLLGRGDMLYASSSNRNPVRIQGAYIDPEIEEIVRFVKTQGEPDYIDESYFEDDDNIEKEDTNSSDSSLGGDDLYTKAWKLVAEKGEATASYLQRRLSIGYNKAANLIEQLEEAGCIGPARGSKPREILKYPDFSNGQ